MLALMVVIANTGYTQNYFITIPEASISSSTEQRVTITNNSVITELNYSSIKTYLLTAPLEFTNSAPLVLELPMANGLLEKFALYESPVMAPALAAKHPYLKTYSGQGISNPTATVKIDVGPNGFHAMVLSSTGDVYIDPYFKNNTTYYQSYYSATYKPANSSAYVCKLEAASTAGNEVQRTAAGNGTQLKTYRIAIACTGEYAAFYGGTVAGATNGIVTTLNRVNGIYEKELAVRLVLVTNNNAIVYINPTTDPFTGNNDASILINESQTEINTRIGAANYDIGHTFSTGAGGLAGLGVVCRNNSKASGVTGSGSPTGDSYDIDFVAHEFGHQFGGDHTFNGVTLNCAGTNRTATSAYEVGSGSTIQAYAGICGTDNLQPNSDAYFHTRSYDQMVNYITSGFGSTCPIVTATNNNFPVISTGTGGFTIPKNTPFTLTGSATDANGDALTYCWEQFDLGPGGINTATSTSGPNFRSYNPVTIPTRTFPRMSDIVANTTSFREVLYNGTSNRVFNFRLTARDNKTAGGGVEYNTLSFVTSGTQGPLNVSSPNTAVTYAGYSNQTVTWDVNNTTATPISCANVSISLSTNGGLTYPIVLVASTPNDGTQLIEIPNIGTTTARIRVACEFSNYTFFDISNTNFTINAVAITVPVSLNNFKAYKQNKTVIAQWQTLVEVNVKHYDVEKSYDGTVYTTIGVVPSLNYSNGGNYQYKDVNPIQGKNYYRLKMVNNDGTYKYSPVALLTYKNGYEAYIANNVNNNQLQLIIQQASINTQVMIYNTNGAMVYQKYYPNLSYINETLLTNNLTPGVYVAVIKSGNNTTTQKIKITP